MPYETSHVNTHVLTPQAWKTVIDGPTPKSWHLTFTLQSYWCCWMLCLNDVA